MEKRWITAGELGEYLGVSIKTARKIGASWGAQKKLGYKTVRYDILIIDQEMTKEEAAENPGRS